MTAKPPKLTGLVISLVVLVAALSALDRFLAQVESAELHGTAQRSYLTGSGLLAAGKPAEAVDFLRDAHAAERQNPAYELTLITALSDAGKTADAGPLMNEMLEREPNDGEVNLIAARLAAKQGDETDAESYYHRAIYGEWPKDAAAHRAAARMELVGELLKRNRKQELLGELIALEAEPATGADVRKRLAQLFLAADSPLRAADLYREMVTKDPKDIAAYEGLGEAELEEGQYRPARAAFLQAFFEAPNDASIRTHLQTLNTVVALDPTLRQLTSEEKYRRSIRILDMTRTSLGECAAKNPQAGAGDSSRLMTAAAAALAAKPPAHVTNEIAEGVLTLAESVWRARNEACGAGGEEQSSGGQEQEDVLDLLMKKLAS